MSLNFKFEDQDDDLETIRMSFRLKLDLLGVDLPPEDWCRIPREERYQLCRRPVRNGTEREILRITLEAILKKVGLPIRTADPERLRRERAAWSDLGRVPGEVVEQGKACGIQVGPEDWSRLDDLERYCLYRLALESPGPLRLMEAYHEVVNRSWGAVYA